MPQQKQLLPVIVGRLGLGALLCPTECTIAVIFLLFYNRCKCCYATIDFIVIVQLIKGKGGQAVHKL